MPRGTGRGYKKSHRGRGSSKGSHHFTNPEELEAMREKEERERQWRKNRGELDSSDEEEETTEKVNEKTAEESAEESSGEEAEPGPQTTKGVEGIIEVENPNRIIPKVKKVTQLDLADDTKPELSRREREELEKQKAKANYMKMHAAGKTDEARADMARLAIIRKQREDAAKKRDEERKAKEAVKVAKTDTLNKALGKGKKT